MPLWGLNQDETFEVGQTVPELSGSFEDNKRLGVLPSIFQALLYVNYERGTETGLEIRVKYSSSEDAPPGNLFFSEAIADDLGAVAPYIFKIAATENLRIPLPIGRSEDVMEVAVRGIGAAPPFTGKVKLYYGVR